MKNQTNRIKLIKRFNLIIKKSSRVYFRRILFIKSGYISTLFNHRLELLIGLL